MRLDEIPGSLILIGAGIMVISGAVTSYANILMKLDAVQLRDEASPAFILRRPTVVMAVSLYVIGGLADLIALGLVPLSLRACASVLTIPFNALFARSKLGEAMTPNQILGSAVTVFSCLIAMLFAAHQAEAEMNFNKNVIDQLFSRKVALFALWTVPVHAVSVGIVYKAVPRVGSHAGPIFPSLSRKLTVLAATAMATSYQCGWTNLFIKSIAVLVQERGEGFYAFLCILLVATAVSGLVQMMLMSSMMRLFESVVVIPPYQILITLWLVVFSSVVFGDKPNNPIGFALSLLFSFFGIVLVAFSQAPPEPSSQDREPLVMMTERI